MWAQRKLRAYRGETTGHRYIVDARGRILFVHGQFCNAGHGWTGKAVEHSTCGRLTEQLRGETLPAALEAN